MIDELKPYPAMKDSGAPSLGDVPEHWDVRPIACRGGLLGRRLWQVLVCLNPEHLLNEAASKALGGAGSAHLDCHGLRSRR